MSRYRIPAVLVMVLFALALFAPASEIMEAALIPFAIYSEQDGWHMGLVRGPAVWLWLAAFGLTFAVAQYVHRAIPQNQPDTAAPNDPV